MKAEEYQSLIPSWCVLKTTQEHIDMLGLCWGITCGRVQDYGITHCRYCEFCKKGQHDEGGEMKTENISDPAWKHIEERDRSIVRLKAELQEMKLQRDEAYETAAEMVISLTEDYLVANSIRALKEKP